MKKLFLLLTFGAFACAKTPTHNLIVLLDYGQSEERERLGMVPSLTEAGTIHPSTSLGATTSTALPALYQQVAPILISKSVLKSIMARKMIFNDFIEQDITQLRQRYHQQPITRAPSFAVFKQHCTYALTMYKKIKVDLEQIFKTGSPEEVRKAIDTLTSKSTYLEQGAPRSLQLYSQGESISEALHRELQVYMLCFLAPIDQFIIKDVSPDSALLVPHTIASKAPYTEAKEVTPEEKKWGLRLNHLKDMPASSLLEKTPFTYDFPLSKIIAQIMVTTKEGSQATWVIYITGHGLPVYPERQECEALEKLKAFYTKQVSLAGNKDYRTQQLLSHRLQILTEKLDYTRRRLEGLPRTHERIICSAPCSEFQKTLEFFNKEIDTSLLYYTCCFGGGEHLDTPYRNRTFNYDIIAGAVSDANSFQDPIMLLIPPYASFYNGKSMVVEGISRDSLDPKQKCLTMRTTLHFDKYFEEARKPNRDASLMAQSLHPYTTIEDGVRQQYHENIAHLRPAGTQQFTVLPTLAIHTVPKNGSTIPEQSQVVFLKEQCNGPVTMHKAVPSIISLIPGTACHLISSLCAPKITLTEVAQACLTIPSLSSTKVFHIKKMECKQDSFISFIGGGKTVLHDVIIARNVPTTDGLKDNAKTSIYYTDDKGTCWHIPVRNNALGSASRISGSLAHGELITLFPALRDTLTQFVKTEPKHVIPEQVQIMVAA